VPGRREPGPLRRGLGLLLRGGGTRRSALLRGDTKGSSVSAGSEAAVRRTGAVGPSVRSCAALPPGGADRQDRPCSCCPPGCGSLAAESLRAPGKRSKTLI